MAHDEGGRGGLITRPGGIVTMIALLSFANGFVSSCVCVCFFFYSSFFFLFDYFFFFGLRGGVQYSGARGAGVGRSGPR